MRHDVCVDAWDYTYMNIIVCFIHYLTLPIPLSLSLYRQWHASISPSLSLSPCTDSGMLASPHPSPSLPVQTVAC